MNATPPSMKERHVSPRRLVPVAAAVLGLGAVAAPAVAHATTPPPTVTQSGNNFIVSLAGIGSLMVTVDPTSGAISNLVATADPTGGFTAGAPAVVEEGVQVTFAAATGSPRVLQVEVDRNDGAIAIKAEAGTAEASEAAELGGDNEHDGASTTSTSVTSTTEAEHEGDDDGAKTTPAPEAERDTSTTAAAATSSTIETEHDSSGDGSSGPHGGSSDGGHDGGSSGSGGD